MMNTIVSGFTSAGSRGPRRDHASGLSAAVRLPAGSRTIDTSGRTSDRATRRGMSYTRSTYASRPRRARGVAPTALFRIR